uniref:VIV iridoviral protein homologue n=1 Tax=Diadromus pulchellus ascovirus 4a TaxID=158683 RepID=Q9DSW2_9VIRU|nr:VIV iridoviral protein homologue [Diadromus pulchellus ascovirus 4a]
MGVQLDETNEQLNEMNNKLDVAVEDRAPIPEDQSKVERFVFLKRPNENYPYYAIRAQAASTKTAIRKQQKEFGAIELLLDFETHPNTKTYYNRIKWR